MRPVLLRMEGFAAFRAETTVDFSGAEYFALVGPTGSGKSTVIDAMVFALYGSVPRWDDRRAVRLALAPTTMRGTVALVFDVGDERYVVARELRRASSGSVTVRSARLERLLDPAGVAAAEEETAPLADGAPKVTDAVTDLLGLPFEDFCTCVVLPQGDFAEFLHAAAGKRQEKLERILGLGVYDLIMRRANTEAGAAAQRAGLLADQVTELADATAGAEDSAAARVTALVALAGHVDEAVPQLTLAEAAVARAEAEGARLVEERAALAGLVVPAGLDELAARQRGAADAVDTAGEQAGVAEDAETAARSALDAAPDRAVLEQTRRAHAELADRRAELPIARERREDAGDAYRDAATAAARATEALEAARTARDAALEADQVAGAEVRRLVAERDALRAPTVPDGLDDLHTRAAAATEALERAEERLAAADTAEAGARTALAGAPARGPLEQARRDHRDLVAARDEHHAATDRRAAAEQEAAAAATRLRDTGTRLDAAREDRARVERADLAAALRPTLVPGAPCPVCDQDVAHLPETLPAADHAGADHAVTAAEQAHEQARTARAAADAALARAVEDVDRSRVRTDALVATLADAPATAAAVDAALADRDRLESAAEEAADAARAARRERDGTARTREEHRREAAAAAGALRTARDPLVALGAPAPDETSPLTAWRELVDWARGQAEVRVAALSAARATAETAGRAREDADRRRTAAQHAATEAQRAGTTAVRAEQEAAGVVAGLQRRIDELLAAVDGAPGLEEVTAGLARIAELEAAARAASAAVRAAREAVVAARRDVSAIEREVAGAWETWRRARDPLVVLGAPPSASDDDLAAAWTTLTTWAAGETTTRDRALTEAEGIVGNRRAARDDAAGRLTDALAAHELTAPSPAGAPTVVATALERARGELGRITERRARAAELERRRAEAEEEAQVARMLGEQLRSNRFPRWLVASALDTLVADASASLADLSGGQFELTHADGEFLVVDHADADAARPVKTLSGGETFQASLALALALSSQLQGLAARGAARLESIFLDEGFGTLDETNLDLVASALENLAARGDRMVGVVTHVPALAERVPVRFAVDRDRRTSSVVREGP